MKTILITGGAGYIGSVLSHRILKSKLFKVIVIDNLSTGKIDFLSDKVKFYKKDILKKKDLTEIFNENKIDTIIHLSASISVEESEKNKLKYKKNNIDATSNLISFAKRYNVKKFIFSSTAAVYGDHKKIKKLNENLKCYPQNYYGKTKLISERDIVKNFKEKDESYVNLRFFNVIGSSLTYKTGPIPTHSKHLIKNICDNIIKKKFKVFIYGKNYKTKDGTCVRDYIHVEDLAEIIYKICLKINRKKNILKTTLNCGYGYGFTVNEIVNVYERIINKKLIKIYQKRRVGDSPIVVCSNSRLKKIINWKPKYKNINFMLLNSLKWFEKYYTLYKF